MTEKLLIVTSSNQLFTHIYDIVSARDVELMRVTTFKKAAALLSQMPDCIIADWMTPDNITGLEFFAFVRSRKEWAHLPGILLVKDYEGRPITQAVTLHKPFLPDELLTLINHCMTDFDGTLGQQIANEYNRINAYPSPESGYLEKQFLPDEYYPLMGEHKVQISPLENN